MSGSAGGFTWKKNDSKALDNRLKEDARSEEYDGKVDALLSDILSQINERPEKISTHLDEIKKAIENEIEEAISLNFGGSVSKHTYVDGISDVDILILLNKTELQSLPPNEVKDYFYSLLKERFPNTDIENGNMAITVKFKDIHVQLLPAIKASDGLKISDGSGTAWSKIKPKAFSEQLTNMNQRLGNKLIPAIKLVKAIVSDLPEQKQLTGYHVESLMCEIFKNYNGRSITRDMVKHFFNESPSYILHKLKDSTLQSGYVDDYLGGKSSLKRELTADVISRIGRRLENADLGKSIQEWKDILNS